jgi:hypothetical protein
MPVALTGQKGWRRTPGSGVEREATLATRMADHARAVALRAVPAPGRAVGPIGAVLCSLAVGRAAGWAGRASGV